MNDNENQTADEMDQAILEWEASHDPVEDAKTRRILSPLPLNLHLMNEFDKTLHGEKM